MSKKSYRSGYNPSKTDLDYLTVSGSLTINGWEAGYLGNAEFMVFLPSDLILNTATSTPTNQTSHVEIGYSDDAGGSKRFSDPVGPAAGYVGSAVVPPAFRATSAVAYGTPGGGEWKACQCEHDTGINVFVAGTLGAGIDMNDTASFTIPVEGSQYVTINYIPNDPASLFHGAQIFLEKV